MDLTYAATLHLNQFWVTAEMTVMPSVTKYLSKTKEMMKIGMKLLQKA